VYRIILMPFGHLPCFWIAHALYRPSLFFLNLNLHPHSKTAKHKPDNDDGLVRSPPRDMLEVETQERYEDKDEPDNHGQNLGFGLPKVFRHPPMSSNHNWTIPSVYPRFGPPRFGTANSGKDNALSIAAIRGWC
jgi:hypothetical protein